MSMKVTGDNIVEVLRKFTDFVNSETIESKQLFATDFDDFLNEQVMADAFGTEGQNDPRGDNRDG